MPQRQDPPPGHRAVPRRAVKRRKAVRRIPLKSLEALSPAEVAAGNRLLRLLPAPLPGERLLDELADQIEQLVGLSHDVFFHAARTYPGAEFSARLDEMFVTTFRLAPDPDIGVLAADPNLGAAWLEEMLEDEPPEARRLGPASPRDFGLVTFVLAHLVNWLCGRGLPPLSLPSSAPDLEGTAQKLRRHAEITEVVYAVTSPRSAGLVRLFVPGDVVHAMEIFVAKAARLQRRRQRLMTSRLGDIGLQLPVTLARAPLARPAFDELAAGDVLLPSEHGFRDDRFEQAGGHARLGLDGRSSCYLACAVTRDHTEATWSIEILDATPHSTQATPHSTQATPHSTQATPHSTQQGEPMSSDASENVESTATHATQLLERAQVDVEVRVGQLPLPVSMLAQVQSGYVLEMERRVDEGVDLVVEGRIVGRGELVNVDGRLGVRVLSIED